MIVKPFMTQKMKTKNRKTLLFNIMLATINDKQPELINLGKSNSKMTLMKKVKMTLNKFVNNNQSLFLVKILLISQDKVQSQNQI